MSTKQGIEETGTGIELPETTFGATEVGKTYLTTRGHQVTVVEVVPDSHAIVQTTKGKELRIPATHACRGPVPVEEAGEVVTPFDDPATDAGTHEDAAVEDAPVEDASATTEPTPKRKRDMTIDDLRAEYERVIGRPTASDNRGYLLWKLAEARKGRIPVGPVNRRAARPKEAMQVLPLGMARDTVAKLDAAVKAMGYKSRMAFIRDAMVARLGFEGSQHGADPAIAEAANAITAESAPAA